MLKCIISRDGRTIILCEVVNHVYAERMIYALNPTLMAKGYKLTYYFEGSPQISEGGMIITLKLSRGLSDEDRKFVKKLAELNGYVVVEE
jgi:hypothetical protein